jgi:hypothetical protein
MAAMARHFSPPGHFQQAAGHESEGCGGLQLALQQRLKKGNKPISRA